MSHRPEVRLTLHTDGLSYPHTHSSYLPCFAGEETEAGEAAQGAVVSWGLNTCSMVLTTVLDRLSPSSHCGERGGRRTGSGLGLSVGGRAGLLPGTCPAAPGGLWAGGKGCGE